VTREQAPSSDLPHEANPIGAVEAILVRWAHAWNRHDSACLAALVATDVDFVTVAGRWLHGRSEFLEWHRWIHLAHLRASHWTNLAYRLRRLRDDLFIVHLEWMIENENRVDESLQSTRSGIFTWLVAPRSEFWCIVAAHNTNLSDGTSRRLTNGTRDTLSFEEGECR
jgi:uncharacterized protein (TIGR02246 family)